MRASAPILFDADQIAWRGLSVEIKRAAVSIASMGANTVVAAVANRKILLLGVGLMAGGTVDLTFKDGASGSALSGAWPLIANTGFVLPFNPSGWTVTSADTLLNFSLSGAVQVSGVCLYAEVP